MYISRYLSRRPVREVAGVSDQVFPKVRLSPFHQSAEPSGGLTKREYLAAHAMQGLLADHTLDYSFADIAKMAVSFADALLAALEEERE